MAVPVSTANAAVDLPDGFILEDTPTGLGGDPLTDFTFLPDESMIAVGKFGKVTWVPRTGPPRQIAALPTEGDGDMGLQGVAVAPDFATSRVVYTTRTVRSTGPGAGALGVLRLSRWTATVDGAGNPTGLTSEHTVLETSADFKVHGMSTVIADDDGTLWVSIGDSANFIGIDTLAFRVNNVDDLHGKVLHVRADGTGVPTNPYFDPANPDSPRSKVYASGFRSPFRFSLDPATKRPILGDVGWNAYEEVNLLSPGNDYGWPCWEGNQRTPGYRDLPACSGVTSVSPLWTYPRASGSSISGGVIYAGKNYPAQYQGRYFFGDYTSHRIWNMAFDSAGNITIPPTDPGFGEDIGQPVKFAATPTGGDIVFADIASDRVRRIVYAPGNNAPVPVVNWTNNPDTREVTFNAEKSWDPNGDDVTYSWQFGDGATATGPVVSHTYPASPQNFTAKLTVTDRWDKTASLDIVVYPSNHAPALTLQPPDPQRTFAVGDIISATASATDSEDGQLSVSWTTDLVHCRGASNCHSHPGVRQENTPDFQLAFEGHPGDSRLEITAVATDSKGAQTSKTFVAKPKQRRITVQSNTPAEFTIGDEQTTSGLFTVGQNLTIVAPEAAADHVSTFSRWSDGASRVRTQVVPDADVNLQVTFLTPIARRYQDDRPARQVLGPPIDLEQGDSRVRWQVYQGGRLYWSPETGARMTMGAIQDRYLTAGGYQELGIPATDELAVPDGRGRYNLFTGGRSIYWTEQTGAHIVFGSIYEKWKQLGGPALSGYPTTDELVTPDGIGRYNHFESGSIYWHPALGAFDVHGGIRDRWAGLGWENSVLGYPRTDETGTPDGAGRFNHFQHGSIYWHPSTGAYEVHGSILETWAGLGYEASPVGYPITNEEVTPDGAGRYNHFQHGSVYWHPSTGAFEVHGEIRARWSSLGWEKSYLGYPTSNEFDVPGGKRSNFQFGYIVYDFATGGIVDRRY